MQAKKAHMKKFLLVLTATILSSITYAQTIEELFNDGNFKDLVILAGQTDTLTGKRLYMTGYAWYRLEDDNKAIEYYDKAIANGFDGGQAHFYKGLSLQFSKRYEEAMKEVDIAIKDEPDNQEFVNEKGVIYYNEGAPDKALKVFEHAISLPKTFPEPYYWIARIYHEQEEFDKALAAFYIAADSLTSDNSYYIITLASIGQLEYTQTHNYRKSAKAYATAIAMNPKDYELYPKLMKPYNAAKEYAKADTIFEEMCVAYNNKELPEDDMKFGTVAVDEYEWNGHTIIVHKKLVKPKKDLDISYKVYLLNKTGDKVERTFLVEQTLENPDGVKHLLCEQEKTSAHITYPYGWKEDMVPLDDLKSAVGLVLDGKMKFGAASTY